MGKEINRITIPPNTRVIIEPKMIIFEQMEQLHLNQVKWLPGYYQDLTDVIMAADSNQS